MVARPSFKQKRRLRHRPDLKTKARGPFRCCVIVHQRAMFRYPLRPEYQVSVITAIIVPLVRNFIALAMKYSIQATTFRSNRTQFLWTLETNPM